VSARILIIEDTEISLELMSYLLRTFGYTVQTAMDGEMGLESARSEPPDLILCDIQMPRMDGYEVARLVKADPALSHIPLVAVTAMAMVGDRERILDSGFQGYLSKPIDPENFVASLEEFLHDGLRATPRTPAPPAVAPGPASGKTGPAPGRKHALLLVVDDSDMERWLLHSVFDPSGYEVLLAANVNEALPLARAMHPDLIICDVMMPGGSGFDMLAAVKADPVLKDKPVILITSMDAGPAERERALAAGAMRFISRPIEPEALLAEIEECLAEIDKGRPYLT
jgi:two-component system cell cycle response regulator